jgi:hypothetical protein
LLLKKSICAGFVIRVFAILITLVTLIFTAACGGPSGSVSVKATTSWPSAGKAAGSSSAAFGAGLGLYDGKFEPQGIEAAAQWLGSSSAIKYAEDFIDATDWSHIADPWQLARWKGSPFTMVWGVPMIPCGGSSTQCATNVSDYDELADGGADHYFKTLAENLVAAGFGTSYIRLGWEFNASWMGWSVCNEAGSGLDSWAKDFVPAYRNIVASMRSVSGANFKFIWNPLVSSNASCPGGNLENFYPGDKYVDMVALDVYDGVGQTTSSAAVRLGDLMNGVNGGDWTSMVPAAVSGQKFKGYGMNWLRAFGQEHHKEIGLPEWGLDPGRSEAGGGDDAYFITQMAKWIKANASGPAVFWNYSDGTLALNIPNDSTGDTPEATAAFKAAFGVTG